MANSQTPRTQDGAPKVDQAATRLLARTLWQIDSKGAFPLPEERKAAYEAAKQDYKKKATQILKALDKRGMTFVISEATSTDSSGD